MDAGRGRRMLLYTLDVKLPNRKSDSSHPVKRYCRCFEWEHVLLHNTLLLCVLLREVSEKGHRESGVEMYVRASLYSMFVCVHVRENRS